MGVGVDDVIAELYSRRWSRNLHSVSSQVRVTHS